MQQSELVKQFFEKLNTKLNINSDALVFLSEDDLNEDHPNENSGRVGSCSQTAFNQRVAALAERLAKHSEQRWLLWADQAGLFFEQFCALCLSGKDIVMPGNAKPGTLAEMRTHFDAALVDDATLIDSLDAQGTQHPRCIVNNVTTPEQTSWQPTNLAEDISITLFTSGTTGEPKGIEKTLSQLLQEVVAQQAAWGSTVGRLPVLRTVSHQHIYGLLHACLWPFWRGAPFSTTLHQYPEELVAAAKAAGPSVLVSSPTHLQRLPESADFVAANENIKAYFSSTGLLATNTAMALLETTGHSAYEILGSTETGGVAYRQQQPNSPAPWQPLPGIHATQERHSGCLEVNGGHIGETPQAMGDRVTIFEDGSFELHGRADTLAKVEGKRMSLQEMQRRLEAHPLVSDARIVILRRKREEVCAVVKLSNNNSNSNSNSNSSASLDASAKKAINQQLKQHLSSFYENVLLPRRWRYVDALPEDAQGKVTRADLVALFERIV